MHTRSRRLLLLAVVAVAMALASGTWLLWPRTAITRENAAKIKEGMTLAEVEAILGGPARHDTTDSFCINPADFEGPINFDFRSGHEYGRGYLILALPTQMDGEVIGWQRGWVSVRGRALVVVRFNRGNRVVEVLYGPVSPGESLLDMLRRWLRL